MGYFDSIYTVYQVASVTLPTVADAVASRLTIEASDRRLKRFARNVVEHAGLHVDVTGVENIPIDSHRDNAFVFMSNHQSHFDVPVLYYSLPVRTLRMVGKTELFRIPLWGRAMRAGGMIEVDRSNRESAIASLGRAADSIASGTSIWIAPEGSRNSNGVLGPLKKGGFHLARDTKTPIIPVALSGTGKVLPRGTLKVNNDQPVEVVIGAPISTEGAEIEDLMADVEAFLLANIKI